MPIPVSTTYGFSYNVKSGAMTELLRGIATVPSALQGTLRGGKVRAKVATYEAAALASGQVIFMDSLPAGSVMLSGQLITDALGSGVTVKVTGGAYNTTQTDNKYLTATACNTANLRTALTPPIGATETPFTYEECLCAVIGGAAATGTIILVLVYLESID